MSNNVKNLRENILVLLFNNEWKLLIGKYNSSKPYLIFSKWGMENGESPILAINRESQEELALDIWDYRIFCCYKDYAKYFTPEEIQWKIENKGEHYEWKVEHIYFCQLLSTEEKIDISITNEFSEIIWIDKNNLWIYIKDTSLLNTLHIDDILK